MLDFCRQSVFFESLKDLTGYLTALSNDPCVEIVRIKVVIHANEFACKRET